MFGLGDIGKMLEQARQLKGRMDQVQQELASERVTGSAGGGMVRVTADGTGRVIDIKIDDSSVDMHDLSMLEQLTITAINQAQDAAKQLAGEKMRQLSGGLQLPGVEHLLGGLMGPGKSDEQ